MIAMEKDSEGMEDVELLGLNCPKKRALIVDDLEFKVFEFVEDSLAGWSKVL